MERIAERLPHPRARTIGIVYLLYFLVAFAAVFVRNGLVVTGDAAATASNILAHQSAYRSGLAVELIGNTLYVTLTALFYNLFAPVDRRISLLAAFYSLMGCAVQIFAGVFQLAPLLVLQDTRLLSAFTGEQLRAVALLSLEMHAQAFNISLVLFALYDLSIGYLIFRSTFLPRTLGVLVMSAGLGWLAFLWPPLATVWASYILPFGALAEILLMLWLLVRGVNLSKWQEKVRSSHGCDD